MHIENGVYESTIGLLLNIPSKTKDGLSARKDIQALEIREKLHPQERPNGKAYLPLASYTLTTKEKRAICKCLHGIRVPTGFSTNIKNPVSMSELKMSGYNTHNCHTMLSLFLTIAIRAVNHPYLKMVITRMCHFFNPISKKVIDVSELDELRKEIRVTMCQLKMCFPPSFFDTMEHYMIHLADHIFVLGPSYMNYMYLYERHMVPLEIPFTLHKKDCQQNILHGMFLVPARDVPVVTHTCTYVFQQPLCRPMQEASRGA
jgi:hypothetical protein